MKQVLLVCDFHNTNIIAGVELRDGKFIASFCFFALFAALGRWTWSSWDQTFLRQVCSQLLSRKRDYMDRKWLTCQQISHQWHFSTLAKNAA